MIIFDIFKLKTEQNIKKMLSLIKKYDSINEQLNTSILIYFIVGGVIKEMKKIEITGFIDEMDKDFLEELKAVKELNMQYIELRSINKKNISELSDEEVYELKKELEKRKIKVSSIGSPIGKIFMKDNFEEHLNKFMRCVKIAEILDVKYIRIFSFFISEGENSEAYYVEIIRRLNVFLEKIKGKNIVLLHENEKNIYGDTKERCLKLVKGLNSEQFKLIFDFANFVQVGENPCEAYECLKEFVEYIHIKDSKYNSSDNVMFGEGEGEIKKILKKFIKKGYSGFLSLEPHLINFSSLQSLEIENISKRECLYEDGVVAFKAAHKKLSDILNEIEEEIIC
ncbi:MAG: sugar phosphate isomerase/epimerase family protein [Fusobacteriaceae bacterium]